MTRQVRTKKEREILQKKAEEGCVIVKMPGLNKPVPFPRYFIDDSELYDPLVYSPPGQSKENDKIRRLCRLVAMKKYQEGNPKPADVRRLFDAMRALDDDSLAHWCTCLMIVEVNLWGGATGTGAVWAMASVVANEMARLVMADRTAKRNSSDSPEGPRQEAPS